MKISIKLSVLVILLIISSKFLFVVKSEKDALQKNIDLVFTNAVSDSMNGLNTLLNQFEFYF